MLTVPKLVLNEREQIRLLKITERHGAHKEWLQVHDVGLYIIEAALPVRVILKVLRFRSVYIDRASRRLNVDTKAQANQL